MFSNRIQAPSTCSSQLRPPASTIRGNHAEPSAASLTDFRNAQRQLPLCLVACCGPPRLLEPRVEITSLPILPTPYHLMESSSIYVYYLYSWL